MRSLTVSSTANWTHLWREGRHARAHRGPCPDRPPDGWRGNETFAAVVVELRTFEPLIRSLDLSHASLPMGWPLHVFHANFSRDAASEAWFTRGSMARAIAAWRRDGRRVVLHAYPDAWLRLGALHRTRPSNTYPRVRAFWTDYFREDKIVTLQSDTGFCPRSPFRLEALTRVDWNGATFGTKTIETGVPGQGGLSLRSRRTMYRCIDWLASRTHGPHANRSVLWDLRWQKNEDGMFLRCMKRLRGARVASRCLANRWSREHPALDALVKGWPPPFGVHDLCRAIATYGECRLVGEGGLGAPPRGDRPAVRALACARKGFSVEHAFAVFSAYCGADLEYMRSCATADRVVDRAA
jgi:hypothetical protein